MIKAILAVAALAGSTQAAFANIVCDPSVCGTPVPEISALEGTAAIAVLAAVVLLAWERRRRAV